MRQICTTPKFLLAAFTALALAACESDRGDQMTTTAPPTDQTGTQTDTTGIDQRDLGPAYEDGSQQHLDAVAGDRVFFDYDRYDLSARAQQTLRNQAEWLQQHPGVNVTIEGHADERGTREYNLALGARRANAVMRYLVGLGVPETRMRTISYGKERPEMASSNESAWAQNRRGVTVIE